MGGRNLEVNPQAVRRDFGAGWWWLILLLSINCGICAENENEGGRGGASGQAEEAVGHPGAFVLKNGVLRLEVMEPDAPERYHTGMRFTPLAAVLRASCGGHEFLFNPRKHDPVADQAGLAAEFDLCIPGGPEEELPPGYREAKIGEGFLKIGVGVLQKQKGAYSLFQNCKALERPRTELRHTSEQAEYRQVCAGVNGYAYELRAAVTLERNAVLIRWTLRNTGGKELVTRQYSHNFIRFDDCDVGPGYELRFPYPIRPSGLQAQQECRADAVVFKERIPQWINLRMEWPTNYTGENSCVVIRPDSGMSLALSVSLPGLYTAVHARAGYLSPEQFVLIRLQPGEEKSWQRSYTFIPPQKIGL